MTHPTDLIGIVREFKVLEDSLAMPPRIGDETDAEYTDRLTGADGTGRKPHIERRFRQCSIGWHRECSDPAGEECECPCHKADAILRENGYHIAQALLDLDENLNSMQQTNQALLKKLTIAVNALEKTRSMQVLGDPVVEEALARIRSLSTPSSS